VTALWTRKRAPVRKDDTWPTCDWCLGDGHDPSTCRVTAETDDGDSVSKGARTFEAIMEQIRQEAVAWAASEKMRVPESRAVFLFTSTTDRGKKLFAQAGRAQGLPGSTTLVSTGSADRDALVRGPLAPRLGATKDLAELRADAGAESRLPHPADIYRQIRKAVDDGDRYPLSLAFDQRAALFFRENPSMHDAYKHAFAVPTIARQEFARALVLDELEPVTKLLRADGLAEGRAVAEALRLLPGLSAAMSELDTRAREGAPITELEKGHAERGAMIAKMADAAREVRKAAVKPIPAREVLKRLLDDRPGFRAAVQKGEGQVDEDLSIEKVRTDPAAYRRYRARSFAGASRSGR
jgi:hypothetical protein